ATDAASPFLDRGYTPAIVREPTRRPDARLVSIDTQSRTADLNGAIAATIAATRSLADRTILFKTIDSTLRGHIRAEIVA
ncbi:four-carbon acid sugar kinase family protein, partial [Acinetobacter baumannii]|uniref:four-carbon acid sugar kinase family protein n=1 Tax=Acinetobacter baumannii TaxID=470 RepID=UPI0013D82426